MPLFLWAKLPKNLSLSAVYYSTFKAYLKAFPKTNLIFWKEFVNKYFFKNELYEYFRDYPKNTDCLVIFFRNLKPFFSSGVMSACFKIEGNWLVPIHSLEKSPINAPKMSLFCQFLLHEFRKLRGLLGKIKWTHYGFSGFLLHVGSLIRLLSLLDSQKSFMPVW